MLDKHDDSLHGRPLERRIVQERVVDDRTGEESILENVATTSESWDGTTEIREGPIARLLYCGHIFRIGDDLVRCDGCSEKAKRVVHVCTKCAVVCPITGQSLCIRCTKLGPDSKRYSPEGYKQAKHMGLFEKPSAAPPIPQLSASPVCSPSRPRRQLLRKLLEWW